MEASKALEPAALLAEPASAVQGMQGIQGVSQAMRGGI
jgi:hypothetical protein